MFSVAAIVLAQFLAMAVAQESSILSETTGVSASIPVVPTGAPSASESESASSEGPSSAASSVSQSSEAPRSSESASITSAPSATSAAPTGAPGTGTNPPASVIFPPIPVGGQGNTPNETDNFGPGDEFDRQSLQLLAYQEFAAADLFSTGLANFSSSDFDGAGIDDSQRFLIDFWSQQSLAHTIALNNSLGGNGSVSQCQHTFNSTDVRSFVDFSQVLTRWGEAGVYGFLPHLTSRPAAQIVLQSVATTAKQQAGFAQMLGRFPTPFWFSMGIPQTYFWSYLVRYITNCPDSNPRIAFNVFPFLNITNQPNPINSSSTSAVSTNNTQLISPGDSINFNWEPVNVSVGPPEQGGYFTASNPSAGPPRFAAFIQQLNITYQPLSDVNAENRTATATFPDFRMFNQTNGPNANGTVFVALTDEDVPLSPFNISQINNHTLAVGWLRAG